MRLLTPSAAAPASALPAAAPVASPAPVAHRVRRDAAGDPDDRAWYGCRCGLQFEAAVSTSVACPHCGVAQPW